MARRAGNQPANAQTDMNAAQRAADAFRLRAEGLSFEEIADRLGYHKADGLPHRGAAYKAYRRALAAIPREAVEEMRANILEQQRIAFVGLLNAIKRGDTFAIRAMTEIHDRQAKLFGLDTPVNDVLAAVPYTKRVILEDAAPVATEASVNG